jgi:hypothetical protein
MSVRRSSRCRTPILAAFIAVAALGAACTTPGATQKPASPSEPMMEHSASPSQPMMEHSASPSGEMMEPSASPS